MQEKPEQMCDPFHYLENLQLVKIPPCEKEKKYQLRHKQFVLEFGLLRRTSADSSECSYVHKDQKQLVKNVHDALVTRQVQGVDEYVNGDYSQERHAVLTLAVNKDVQVIDVFQTLDTALEQQSLCLSNSSMACHGIIHDGHALEPYRVTLTREALHAQREVVWGIERFMRQYSELFVRVCDKKANYYALLAILSKPSL